MTAWDDSSLGSTSDTTRTAAYRRAQSRWRDEQLRLDPGTRPRGTTPVGNMLPDDYEGDANFLTTEGAAYARNRLATANDANGDAKLDDDRLHRNLLSSMPLCFNLFGHLDAHRPAAARLLSAVLGLDIARIIDIRVEHAPPVAREALGDGTAFDALVRYESDGKPGFLAIETKYTEPFSVTRYEPTPKYTAATNSKDGWFQPGTADYAAHPATNQLWRNTMLAQLTEERYWPEYGHGRVIVVTAAGDTHAQQSCIQLGKLLKDPHRRLHHVLLEELVGTARTIPGLARWAALFSSRYLEPDWIDVP